MWQKFIIIQISKSSLDQMNAEQLRNREIALLKEIEALSTICSECHEAEEQKKCQILVNTECKLDLCIDCYKINKAKICKICTKTYQQHYKKNKTAKKSTMVEDASKLYNRQFKIRSIEQFQQLEPDFLNLMAYFHIHPQGKKYNDPERDMKRLIESKKKEQRTIISETVKIKQAQYINKDIDSDNRTGRESCGCPVDYKKGLTLIRRCFGFTELKVAHQKSNH